MNSRSGRAEPALAALLVCGLVATSAAAADGVVEIHPLCATTTGCFSGDAPGYPVVIDGSAGRSYRLTGDLVLPDADTTGILIGAPDVRIDLGGFRIVRAACGGAVVDCTPSEGSGRGIVVSNFTGVRGVAVRNGSIIGMGDEGLLLGRQAEVRDVRARWNRGTGIEVLAGSTVTGCAAWENGDNGIAAGSGSVVSGSSAAGNAGSGIWVFTGASVLGSAAWANGGDGITAGEGSTVSGNTCFQNAGDGIEAGPGSTAAGNTVRGNGGFGLRLGTGSAWRDNTVTGNAAGTVEGGVQVGGNVCNGSGLCP